MFTSRLSPISSLMMAHASTFRGLGLFLVVLIVGMNSRPATAQGQIENAFPSLSFTAVTDVQAPPDGSDRLFVLERAGRIRAFEADRTTSVASTFLDIRDQVDTQGEGGLLGLAFHPQYAENGRFFVNYTTSQNGPFRTVVARFTVSASDSNAASPGSETIVLTVEQPFSNHNAGQLQFGPDGFLYVGLGDGGSGGDPEENGQDPTTLLGSMLRLDVDLDGSGASPDCGSGAYGVPPSNPFVDDDAKCDEIYAFGFRNPYRYSFGPEGRLWVADVGQNSWEEIDWVTAGENYGWDVMEGAHCYEPSSGCDTTGLELPVFEYSHSEGNSITGGYVADGGCGYIEGRYVYGDYGNGRIWALSYDADGAVSNELLLDSPLSLTTFGVGPDDRLYVAGIFDDALYRFDCSTLPVEMTGFTGRVDDGAVHLRWQTASETNNARFVVQRRVAASRRDGPAGWGTVGQIFGAGTTTKFQSYRFVDDQLPFEAEVLRYRLKQVDTDGTASLSSVVTVRREPSPTVILMSPAPHPVRQRATARYVVPTGGPHAVRLDVFDLLGRRVATLVDEVQGPGRKTRSVDAGAWPSGVYLLRLQVGGAERNRRITVAR